MDSVPIVHEFLNVFLKDLIGLPSDQELEFRIELLPSLAPVSIPLGFVNNFPNLDSDVINVHLFPSVLSA